MAFSGTWQVYAQENYEEFLKAMGEHTRLYAVALQCCTEIGDTHAQM